MTGNAYPDGHLESLATIRHAGSPSTSSPRLQPAERDRYVKIPYPGGDVSADTGVCTDQVIRAYRALGVYRKKSTKT